MRFLPLVAPIAFSVIGLPAHATETLTFADVLQMARAKSLELRKAENALTLAKHEKQALEQKDDAKLTASASGTARYSESPTSGTTSRSSLSTEPGSFDEAYGLQTTGSLFDFGRTAAERTKANFLVDEKASSVAEANEALVFRVSRAYAKVLSAQAVADLAARQIQNATQKYAQVKENYNRGLRPEYDVVRAESDLGRAGIAARKSQDELALALQALQSLITDASNSEILVNAPQPRCQGTLKKSKDAWKSLASKYKEKNSVAAFATRKAQRAGNAAENEAINAKLFPNLSATGGAALSRSTPFPKTQSNEYRTTYNGALTLSWDIPWNLAYRDDKMRVALRDKDFQIAEETEIKTRADKAQAAIARAESLAEQTALMEKQVELVLRNLSIVKQKYDAGKASATELSVAEDEAISTQTEAVRTQASTADALFDLAEANGNTNTEPIFAKD